MSDATDTGRMGAEMGPAETLVLLGCGYSLSRLAAVEAKRRRVVGSTRSAARRTALEKAGVVVHGTLFETLEQAGGAHVVVGVPPEAGFDGEIAVQLRRVRPARILYLSSTGVYGGAGGLVDEDTPVDAEAEGAAGRLAGERNFRALGAIALRIAGIYGPGRGLHVRLRSGQYRLPGDGTRRVSRIHVDDLGAALRVALEQATAGTSLCVADDAAAQQIEVVRWLCERLGVPVPPAVPLEEVPASLRGDRAVSNLRLRGLGWSPAYPTYREGFAAVLAEEARG